MPAAALAVGVWGQDFGVRMRFLANPPTDSIAKYTVYRSQVAGSAGTAIGEVAPGGDTLSFDDYGADKGKAYWYAVQAVTRSGIQSEISTQTPVAAPILDLPDSLPLHPGTPYVRVNLPDSAHPLRMMAPLDVEIHGISNVLAVFDRNESGIFLYSPAASFSGRITLRIGYYGRFSAEDILVISLPQAPMGLQSAAASGRIRLQGLPGVPGSGQVALRIDNPPADGILLIASPNGRHRVLRVTGNSEPWIWKGSLQSLGLSPAMPAFAWLRDAGGRSLAPAIRLLPR